jgi:hypothetical protein
MTIPIPDSSVFGWLLYALGPILFTEIYSNFVLSTFGLALNFLHFPPLFGRSCALCFKLVFPTFMKSTPCIDPQGPF